MSSRAGFAVLALGLMMGACSDGGAGGEAPIASDSGAATPIDAVEELVGAINEPDFTDASRLAVPEHAALAALAEGATFAEVAESLREGDREVAANFWAGFAQGTGSFLIGSVDVAGSGTVAEGSLEFHNVSVTPSSGDSRALLVRDVDGYRVDLFASFGAGLADKMTAPVERLLTTQTADSRLILTRLQEIVPSLLAAARLPGTPGDVSQQLLALVEVITRVG